MTVRLIGSDETEAWVRSSLVPFLHDVDAEVALRHWGTFLEPDRTWAAVEDGRFVGNCCAFSREVTLPASPGEACPSVPFAAVSGVGVHPTHRRRGLLGEMMATMLDDARRRGEVLAGLLASESVIYGRYGFGVATHAAERVIETSRSAFVEPVAAGGVTLLDAREAAAVLPELFEQARRCRSGQVDRPGIWWDQLFEDPPELRRGQSGLFFAVADGGFAAYRAEEVHSDLVSARLRVRDLAGVTPEAEATLWRFVLDVDLVREVVAYPRPLQEPLVHRLADPRQLRTRSVHDHLWLRVLDVPGALTARGYRYEGRLVLDIAGAGAGGGSSAGAGAGGGSSAGAGAGGGSSAGADPAVGRWVLEAGPDGSSCRPARLEEGADLRLGVAALGSLVAGGVPASALAEGGRVVEERAGALDVADAVFSARPAPFCATGF